MTLRVISCQSHPGPFHAQFLASAARFGVYPQVLVPARWDGLTTKLQTVYGWLRAENLPDEDLVLFADAWDTFFVKPLYAFEAGWQTFGSDLVFSAETNCAPNADLAGRYPTAPTRYAYLNSGLYAGRPGALLEMLEEMRIYKMPPQANDQLLCSEFFLSHPGSIALDYPCKLFGSLYQAEEDYGYSGPIVVNKRTGERPFCLHGNGSSSVQGVLDWLNLIR